MENGVQISEGGGVSPWVTNGQGMCVAVCQRFRRYNAVLGCVLGLGACASQVPLCMCVCPGFGFI